MQKLPAELVRVDVLLRRPDALIARPSTPVETYAVDVPEVPPMVRVRVVVPGGRRLDHLAGFCRIALDGAIPHPTPLMKLTTRCGSTPVDGGTRCRPRRPAEGLHDPAAERRRGRLVRAANGLSNLLEATAGITAQTRQRIAGTTPDGLTPVVNLHDQQRPIAKGRLGKPSSSVTREQDQHQAWLHMGPHPDRWHCRSKDLDRTRGPGPQR